MRSTIIPKTCNNDNVDCHPKIIIEINRKINETILRNLGGSEFIFSRTCTCLLVDNEFSKLEDDLLTKSSILVIVSDSKNLIIKKLSQ